MTRRIHPILLTADQCTILPSCCHKCFRAILSVVQTTALWHTLWHDHRTGKCTPVRGHAGSTLTRGAPITDRASHVADGSDCLKALSLFVKYRHREDYERNPRNRQRHHVAQLVLFHADSSRTHRFLIVKTSFQPNQ